MFWVKCNLNCTGTVASLVCNQSSQKTVIFCDHLVKVVVKPLKINKLGYTGVKRLQFSRFYNIQIDDKNLYS